MESEVADLLDRRMMSLFGVQQKQATKLDVQNTSRRLQAAQHITQGGIKSPERLVEDSIDEKGRASVTIGLSPSGTYSSIDGKAVD